jgi:hypothetical protein
MSHGKHNKRGHSLYLENYNPNAKKYIVECKICGFKGYSPAIKQPDFLSNKGSSTFTVNKAFMKN